MLTKQNKKQQQTNVKILQQILKSSDIDAMKLIDYSSSWGGTGLFETLLEVFDGYNFLSGSIIIVTTNYLEKLDLALIRPGRIDHKFYFDYPTIKEIKRIFQFFYNLDDNSEMIKTIEFKELSSSELINSIILPNLTDCTKAIQLYSNI